MPRDNSPTWHQEYQTFYLPERQVESHTRTHREGRRPGTASSQITRHITNSPELTDDLANICHALRTIQSLFNAIIPRIVEGPIPSPVNFIDLTNSYNELGTALNELPNDQPIHERERTPQCELEEEYFQRTNDPPTNDT